MKRAIIILSSLFILSILSSCGNEKDFKEAEWGMSVDDVMDIENENDNKLNERHVNESDSETTDIYIEDITVNGIEANATYSFFEEIGKEMIISSFLEDESGEKLKELEREYEKLPETFQLDKEMLLTGSYRFQDVSENESNEIYDFLVDEYGEPDETYDEDEELGFDEAYKWLSERTEIYFNGEDFVSYSVASDALENLDKSIGKKDDSQL